MGINEGLVRAAMAIWDKGIHLFSTQDKDSLYVYNNKYYIIHYNDNNIVEDIFLLDQYEAERIIRDYGKPNFYR
jgi:hypothetical protein